MCAVGAAIVAMTIFRNYFVAVIPGIAMAALGGGGIEVR